MAMAMAAPSSSSPLLLLLNSSSSRKGLREKEWSQAPWLQTLNRLLDSSSSSLPLLPADSSLFAALLRRCGDARSLPEGRRIHAHLRASGLLRNRYLKNLLLHMYAKCGAVQEASLLFATFGFPDVFSWTFFIAAHAHAHGHYHDHGSAGSQLFQQMQQQGELPNHHTLVYVLSLCANHSLLAFGKVVHALAVGGGRDHMPCHMVVCSLINMYGKCGCLRDALQLFDAVPDASVVAWNALISAYLQHGHGAEALRLFGQMKEEAFVPSRVTFLEVLDACSSLASRADGKRIHGMVLSSGLLSAEVTLGNSVINMYAKCGDFRNALAVFDAMPERNVATWNTLISVGSSPHRHCRQAERCTLAL